jgi:ABC-type glycerol-3-phosphate transport system substrate-binding protein
MHSDPHWSATLDRISSEWNGQHPDRPIAFDVEFVPHARLYDRLSAAVGDGTAPDLAVVDSVWVAGLADAGFLHALGDGGSAADHPTCWEGLYPDSVQANSFEGLLYGLPVKADASLLWYRKDWFAQEGLTPPQRWDELVNNALHFVRPDIRERYGLDHPLAFPGGTAGGEATVYTLLPLIWSAGGDVIDANSKCITLNRPETADGLRFVRELTQKYRVTAPEVVDYPPGTSSRLLAEGRVAMALGGSYQARLIQSLGQWSEADFSQHVGATPPPAPRGRHQVSTVGGSSYVLLRQCKCPALTMDMLRVATDVSVIGDLYRSKWFNLPSLSFNETLNPETEPLLGQIAEMIASGRARPSIAQYVQVSRPLQMMFERAISGTEPIEDITQDTARIISVITNLACQAALLPGRRTAATDSASSDSRSCA